jgi:hypothetical protein
MFWERAKSPLVGYHTPGWENLQRPDICPKISLQALRSVASETFSLLGNCSIIYELRPSAPPGAPYRRSY